MPKFDVTRMRAHLKDYMKEIGDLLTSESHGQKVQEARRHIQQNGPQV